MTKSVRQTKLIVDLDAIFNNIVNIKKELGDVMLLPVIKANAYGTYINKYLEIFHKCDINYVAVALVDEAIELRNNGYIGNILVLNPILVEEVEAVLEYDVVINGCDLDMLKYISNIAKREVKIHIEIETGMTRTGVKLEDLDTFIDEVITLDNIVVEGVFSHFSSSSKDREYSLLQINKFEEGLAIIKHKRINIKYIHMCNSGAMFNYKECRYNMVRIGIMLYGYYPSDKIKNYIDLKPSLTLKTKINFIQSVKANTAVGYNKNYITNKDSIIATIPFGFADGLIGLETGEPYVIINELKIKIVAICMDYMMIDVTDIPNVKVGTDVFIWDNKNITVEEVAKWCNGICNYEIISSLSERIPREFI